MEPESLFGLCTVLKSPLGLHTGTTLQTWAPKQTPLNDLAICNDGPTLPPPPGYTENYSFQMWFSIRVHQHWTMEK